MVSRQRNELNATVVEQRAGTYQERINRLLRKARKDRIDVTAGGGLEDFDLLPNGQGRSLNVRDKGLSEGIVGIDQHANAHGSRLQLMQQPKLLCPKLSNDKRDTGDIAARPVEAGDEAELNRVAAACEDDRDRRSRRLGYNCRGGVTQRSPSPDGVPDRLRVRAVGRIGPAPSDTRSPHSGPRRSRLHEGLGGMRSKSVHDRRRRAAEEPDHRHRRLLRARRERPRGRRAAEQRDELAASDESCHLIPPAGRGTGTRIAQSYRRAPRQARGRRDQDRGRRDGTSRQVVAMRVRRAGSLVRSPSITVVSRLNFGCKADLFQFMAA